MGKIGDLVHEEYLKKRREEKKRKSSLDMLDRGDVKTSKMQKKIEDDVKEEKFDTNSSGENISQPMNEKGTINEKSVFENGTNREVLQKSDDQSKGGRSCKKTDAYVCEDEDFDSVKENNMDNDEFSSDIDYPSEGKDDSNGIEDVAEHAVNENCVKNLDSNSSRSCKKTDAYQFDTDIEFGSKSNFTGTCYTPSSRNCKKKDSYEFEDEDFS